MHILLCYGPRQQTHKNKRINKNEMKEKLMNNCPRSSVCSKVSSRDIGRARLSPTKATLVYSSGHVLEDYPGTSGHVQWQPMVDILGFSSGPVNKDARWIAMTRVLLQLNKDIQAFWRQYPDCPPQLDDGCISTCKFQNKNNNHTYHYLFK